MRRRSGTTKRIAHLLLMLMVLSMTFGSQPVAGGSNIHPGGSSPSPKHETIFATLDYHGNIADIYVVNTFLEPAAEIVDYGSYKNLLNLTNRAEPVVEGERITFAANGEEKIFRYQGTLRERELPWEFEIGYFLDGRSIEPEQLPGAAGRLRIELEVRQNPHNNAFFAENFMVQLSVALEMDKATVIAAPAATKTFVGNTVTLAFTFLPDSAAALYYVEADVRDFRMDGISIAALDAALPLDDMLADLESGFDGMTDGMEALIDGTEQLQAGMVDLDAGVERLYDGVVAIDSGKQSLVKGMDEYAAGLSALTAGLGELGPGAAGFNEALSGISAALPQLSGGYVQIEGGIDALLAHRGQLEQLALGLAQSRELLDGIDAIDSGGQALVKGMDEYAAGLAALTAGLGALGPGAAGFNEALTGMTAALPQLSGGYAQVEGGINAMLAQGGQVEQLALELAQSPDPQVQMLAEAMLGQLAGLGQLQSGINQANEGLAAHSGALGTVAAQFTQFDRGFQKSLDGARQLENNFSRITSATRSLLGGVGGIKSGVGEFKQHVRLLAEAMLGQLAGLGQLQSGINKANEGLAAHSGALSTVAAQFTQFDRGFQKSLDGAGQLENNFSQITTATRSLSGGVGGIKSGIGELKQNTPALPEAAQKLIDGQKELQDGVKQARYELVLPGGGGNQDETVSFVAPEKANAQSVQFVFRTPAVEEGATPVVEIHDDRRESVWQRFLDLFRQLAYNLNILEESAITLPGQLRLPLLIPAAV